jgi:hypothetical protein
LSLQLSIIINLGISGISSLSTTTINFGLRASGVSTLNSFSSTILPPKFNDVSMCVPHRSTTVAHFCSLGFESFNSQLLFPPEMISPEDDDMLMHVPHRSMVVVTSALWASRVSTPEQPFSPGVLSPGVHGSLSCVLMNRMTTIRFDYLGFEDLNFYTINSSWSGFTRSRRSVDTYLLATNGQDLLRLFSSFTFSLSTKILKL